MVLAPTRGPKELVARTGPGVLVTASAPQRSLESVPIDDLAAFLTGRWRIERRIDHAVEEAGTHFHGVATFFPDGTRTLSYREEGTFTVAASVLEARRELAYHLVTRSSADVHLADGGFFHALDLSTGHDRVRHDCGADAYVGRFLVASRDAYLVEWTVLGPNKAYRSASLFTRLEETPNGPL